MTEIHTADEHIAVDDLERMVDVTLALVEGARNGARLRRGQVTASSARGTGSSGSRSTAFRASRIRG